MKHDGALRVVVATTSFPLSSGSSSGIFVKRLVTYLPPEIAVVVVTPASADSSVSPETDSRYDLLPFRYAPRPLQLLAHRPGGIPVALRTNWGMYLLLPFFLCAFFISALREARKSHVVHANWALAGAIAGLAGRLTGIPVVTTFRGEDANRIATSRLSKLIVRMSLKLSDRAATVSEAVANAISAVFPEYSGKVEVIPNGVDDALLEGVHSPTDGPFRLLFVGSLIPRKGVDKVLRAVHRLRNLDWRLTIVGDGPERSRLINLSVQLGISPHIEFMSSVPPENIRGVLARHDLLLLLSSGEGRPNVVLEAFASGLPVVASDIPGTRELVRDGENGYLVKADTPEDVAGAIARLARDPARCSRFGAAARSFIRRNNLTWHATGLRYAEIYHALKARRDRGNPRGADIPQELETRERGSE